MTDDDNSDQMSTKDAEAALIAFFRLMKVWELNAKRLFMKEVPKGTVSPDEARNQIQMELRAIYDSCCETGAKPSRLEPKNLHFGTRIPEYDEELEKVLTCVRAGQVTKIQTLQTHFAPYRSLIYELRLTESGWRIKDNRKLVNPDGSLASWDL